MSPAQNISELVSSINRLGPEKGRGVEVRLIDGTAIFAHNFAVVGQLIQAITNPSNPRESYALVNPSAVIAYLPWNTP